MYWSCTGEMLLAQSAKNRYHVLLNVESTYEIVIVFEIVPFAQIEQTQKLFPSRKWKLSLEKRLYILSWHRLIYAMNRTGCLILGIQNEKVSIRPFRYDRSCIFETTPYIFLILLICLCTGLPKSPQLDTTPLLATLTQIYVSMIYWLSSRGKAE